MGSLKNSIIILILALVISAVLPHPFLSRTVLTTGVFLAIGMLVKELRKQKMEE